MSKPIKMYTLTPAVFMALQFTPNCKDTNAGLEIMCQDAHGKNSNLEIDEPKGTVTIGGQVLMSGDFIVLSEARKLTIKSEADFVKKYQEFERRMMMLVNEAENGIGFDDPHATALKLPLEPETELKDETHQAQSLVD